MNAYLELTKPRLTTLAILSGALGFILAASGPFPAGTFLAALLGITLVGAGAGTLNQALERLADSKMLRTRARPVPSGRVGKSSAIRFGLFLSGAGIITLGWGTSLLAALLGTATLVSYLLIYTPMKRTSHLCTLMGAIPGALPPVIGWAAARGSAGLEAWLLFGILFVWQLPHFLSLAWNLREDYIRAGFKVLPALDTQGHRTFRQIALYCLALIPVSLLPAFFGMAGEFYFLAAFTCSFAFWALSLKTAHVRSDSTTRRFFLASVLYLPLLFAVLLIDHLI